MKLLPQRVKNGPIVPDSEELIWGRYPVRVSVLGIPKDSVGEPNKADHIANGVRERKRHFSGDIINPKIPLDFSKAQAAASISRRIKM